MRISNIARVFTPLYPPPPEPATPKGNLVPNGDFEIGLTGWRGDNYGDINLVWETTTGYSPPPVKNACTALRAPARRTDVYSRPIPRPPRPTLHLQRPAQVHDRQAYYPRFEVCGCGDGSRP